MNKIYVLEDDPDIMDIVEMILVDEQFEVTGFYNCKDFLVGIEQDTPDLFLLDVRLPDGNGLEICQQLSDNPATKDIPVLMMSAHEKSVNVYEMTCAKEFIPKPFDISELIRIVKKQFKD